jgi:hypothetical protein
MVHRYATGIGGDEMSEVNYNDLIAEWLDSLDERSGYYRAKDGRFIYIDVNFNWGGDFDKFVKEKMNKHE